MNGCIADSARYAETEEHPNYDEQLLDCESFIVFVHREVTLNVFVDGRRL